MHLMYKSTLSKYCYVDILVGYWLNWIGGDSKLTSSIHMIGCFLVVIVWHKVIYCSKISETISIIAFIIDYIRISFIIVFTTRIRTRTRTPTRTSLRTSLTTYTKLIRSPGAIRWFLITTLADDCVFNIVIFVLLLSFWLSSLTSSSFCHVLCWAHQSLVYHVHCRLAPISKWSLIYES